MSKINAMAFVIKCLHKNSEPLGTDGNCNKLVNVVCRFKIIFQGLRENKKFVFCSAEDTCCEFNAFLLELLHNFL